MKRTLAFFTLVFTAANLFGVDTIHFSQSSVDRLVIDPDIGPEVRTTETGSFNASITVPGLSLSAVTDDTLLEVAIGNFQFSNVVGEGDDPSPNCVRFTNEIGRITFCISGNVITITGSGQSELEPFFVDPLFEEEGNRASGTLDASITIGDYSIQRVVHYQFTRTVTQRVVDMEPYELETVTGAGDTDNQRPTITLTSPAP